MKRFRIVLPVAAMSVAALFPIAACHHAAPPAMFIDTAVVTRQSISITVAATGTIQPAEVVQVKSKASGLIIRMPVQMGTLVKAGDLIAQIDPRDAQSRYNQAVAALNAARANLSVTRAAKGRADTLYDARALTAPEHEQATVGYANAQSSVATAQTNLEVAQIQLADVTIDAPEAGTIINKEVSEGQVIASATNSVSGGTTLVTLANLGNIVDSALVTESDIGKVKIGQVASVTVDAYPNKVFHGSVDKVSPQAVTLQSVTMFPVIIRLDNSSNLLKPGMNSDVSILAASRPSAVVIPNDAIGTSQDVAAAGVALGLNMDSLRQARGSQRTKSGAPDTTAAGRGAATSGRGTGARGSLHTDSANGALAGVSDTNATLGGDAGAASAEPHSALVLVLVNGKFTPRRVTLGLGNYDVTEVISGLEAGDKVALVAEVRVQQSRDSSLSRIQGRSGLPGIGGATGGGGARGGGGGGGARGGRGG